MLKALRQKKADAVAKANGIFQAASTAGREFSRDERTEYNAIMDPRTGTLALLDADIERAERLQDEERNTPNGSTIVVGQNRAEKRPFLQLRRTNDRTRKDDASDPGRPLTQGRSTHRSGPGNV